MRPTSDSDRAKRRRSVARSALALLFVARARAAALRRARVGGRAGVGRALLRLRRAAHRRGPRLLGRSLAIDGIVAWHPWCHYPVGYSAFLGAVLPRLRRRTCASRPSSNALVGAALAVVTWPSRATRSRRRARALAGVLVGASPGAHPLRGARHDRAARGARSRSSRSGSRRVDPTRATASRLVAGRARARRRRARATAGAPLRAVPRAPRARRARSRRFARSSRVGRRGARVRARARPGAPVDRAQLPRDGRLRARQHQRRLEPRHRRVPARDRPLRDAPLVRRLPRGHRARCSRTAAGSRTAWARSARTRGTGSRSSPRSSSFTFDHESFAVEYLHEARPERVARGAARRRGAARTSASHRLLVVRGCARVRRVRVPQARRGAGRRVRRRARARGARGLGRRARVLAARARGAIAPVAAAPGRARRCPTRCCWRSGLVGDDRRHARRLLRRGPLSRGASRRRSASSPPPPSATPSKKMEQEDREDHEGKNWL